MAFTSKDPNSVERRPEVTKEDDQASIKALLEEKRGYKVRGLDDRAAEVDAQLKALGAKAEKKSARAQKRPAVQKASSKR